MNNTTNMNNNRTYLLSLDTLKTICKGALGSLTFGVYHQFNTNKMMELNNKYFHDKLDQQDKEIKEYGAKMNDYKKELKQYRAELNDYKKEITELRDQIKQIR